MSLFDLAAKFGGLSTQESDDHEGYTGPRDYGYTQTSDYQHGYDGSPPTGYPSGPQQGQTEYKQSHDGYGSSDPTRAAGQESAYAAPPSADEYHPQQSDLGRGDRPASPPLPEGWVKRFDERHGKWYYVDETTGTSQWEPPKRSYDDDASRYGAHGSQEQVYDAHSGAGEASGYYAGHQYGQNAPAYGQQATEDPYGQRSGASYGQGYYGGEQQRSGAEEERKSSGYGGALLGVAGGLAVGAIGGALIANAMDSDPETEDPPAEHAYRSYQEPVYEENSYPSGAALEDEEKHSSDSDEEEPQEDTESSDSEEEEEEEESAHESSDSGSDEGSNHKDEEREYASGDDEESGERDYYDD
ncbi:hypothetical protein ACHAQA_007213 [Verticillium albo-atrum]